MAVKHTGEEIRRDTRRRVRRRRGSRALYSALLLLFLVAAGVVLSLTVLFKVERVTVVGTDKYPPDEVAAASGILPGENLFRIDKKAAVENILAQYPYLEEAEVHRRLPAAVQIDVVQSTPSAAIALDRKSVV